MRTISKYTFITLISIFLIILPVYAGDINPPGEPDSENSSMYNIEVLYDLINKRQLREKRGDGEDFSGPFDSGAESTGHTLDEIYDLIQERAGIMQPTSSDNFATEGVGIPWPKPRFSIFIYGCDDNEPDNCTERDDTVLDNLTRLEWTRTPTIILLGNYSESTGRQLQVYKEKVEDYNNNVLDEENLLGIDYRAGPDGGYTDWRCPTIREASTLFDPGHGREETKSGEAYLYSYRKKPFMSDTTGDYISATGDPFIILRDFKDKYGLYCIYTDPDDEECTLGWSEYGKWVIISTNYWPWHIFRDEVCDSQCPVCDAEIFCPEGLERGQYNPLCEHVLAFSFEKGSIVDINLACIDYYPLMLVRRMAIN